MTFRRTIFSVALAFLSLCISSSLCAADPATKSAPDKAALATKAKYKIPDNYESIKVDATTTVGRMVIAARKCLTQIEKKEFIVPSTPDFLEIQMRAARRLRDAEMLAAKTKEERTAVSHTYVAFAERLSTRVAERVNIDADMVSLAMADYLLAEAEYLLEQETK